MKKLPTLGVSFVIHQHESLIVTSYFTVVQVIMLSVYEGMSSWSCFYTKNLLSLSLFAHQRVPSHVFMCLSWHILQILFARAEALHAHGHTKEACRLAQKLAEEMLNNPPDLLADSANAPSPKCKLPISEFTDMEREYSTQLKSGKKNTLSSLTRQKLSVE